VFILPVLVGWALGARLGFLLGAFTMLTSAVITAGVGPWLPFQMFALGWVGAGAGLLRRLTAGRFAVPALTFYALVSSLAYGYAMTLWFWPFLGGGGPLFFSAGLPPLEALVRYTRYYAVTSFGWDVGRALLANVPLVAVLARPVTELLERTGARMRPVLLDAANPSALPFPLATAER
jgi:energy-coupling factor transport system substrate-specific component